MTQEGARVTPANIMQIGLGFWGSKALLSAIELGVFSELAAGPLEGEELSRRLGLHERSYRDFFDTLVACVSWIGQTAATRIPQKQQHSSCAAARTYLGGMLEMANERFTGSGDR